MKKIDPIERALDAYSELDVDQRRTFHSTVVRVEKELDRILGKREEITQKPTRGRPAGSKNRKPLIPPCADARVESAGPGSYYETCPKSAELELRLKEGSALALDLRHNNGATTESL